MNTVVNKFLLAQDEFIPEMHKTRIFGFFQSVNGR